MLTISERKALQGMNGNVAHIKRAYHRPGATVSAPPRAAGPYDGGASSEDNLRTARGIVYGVLLCIVFVWLPFFAFVWRPWA